MHEKRTVKIAYSIIAPFDHFTGFVFLAQSEGRIRDELLGVINIYSVGNEVGLSHVPH